MLPVAVLLAVVGALFIALGSAIQERVVVGARGGRELAFLLHLVTNPRWVLGGVCAGAGVLLHVLALSQGPVSVIQPVGTSGLFFAISMKAILDRRRLRRSEAFGAVAIVAGLAGLLLALPASDRNPSLTLTTALLLGVSTLVLAGVAISVAVLSDSRNARAIALAFAAGITFGVGSALVGVIGHRALVDLSAVLDWPSLLVVVLLVSGGLAQQHAYRVQRFALAFAILEIADPVAAATVGVLVLDEPMPGTAFAAAWMALSATVIVLGVVVLARSYLVPHRTQ